jgi:hypothetical protein
MKPNTITTTSLHQVREVLVEALGIENRAVELDAATPLLGAQPEIDSMGGLTAFVDSKLP